ncbi:uncharacterized protein BJ171DRAFT_499043 [Polychytrium aggregatum]|uniref:uncharacterized protein n=1 Tax=Polychytrium aggregatum TaxID=110093 RepID=UPI0022FF2191|nr:uncharacterized protein BJ171DRAFT_499043 [Polychytrium aggregatum]KAI9206183.1 hypothetical protein BJ171DRAFT_499043 [Polychytrium aggregatum]
MISMAQPKSKLKRQGSGSAAPKASLFGSVSLNAPSTTAFSLASGDKPAAAPPSSNPSTASFSFGSAPAFTFGTTEPIKSESPTVPTGFSFGMTTESKPAAAMFQFGSTTETQPTAPTLSFGATAEPKKDSLSSTDTTAAAAPSSFSFGASLDPKPVAPVFSFGSSNATSAAKESEPEGDKPKPFSFAFETSKTFTATVPTFGFQTASKSDSAPSPVQTTSAPSFDFVPASVPPSSTASTRPFSFAPKPAEVPASNDSIGGIGAATQINGTSVNGSSSSADSTAVTELAKQLRGLNVSFVDFIKAEVEKDCFVDLSDALDSYKQHMQTITKAHASTISALKDDPAGSKLVPKAAASGGSEQKTGSFNFGSTTSTAAAPSATTSFSFATTTASTLFSTIAAPASSEPPKLSTTSAAVPPTTFFSGFGSGPASTISFGGPAPTAFVAGGDASKTTAGDQAGDDDEPAPDAQIDTSTLMQGEGEEQDEVFHEVRSKLFRFSKDKSWENIGIGPLKINKNKSSGKARLLLRADGNGRVLLNASIFAGMQAKAEGKAVTFTVAAVGEDKKPELVKYSARVKTEDMAKALVDAIASSQ